MERVVIGGTFTNHPFCGADIAFIHRSYPWDKHFLFYVLLAFCVANACPVAFLAGHGQDKMHVILVCTGGCLSSPQLAQWIMQAMMSSQVETYFNVLQHFIMIP